MELSDWQCRDSDTVDARLANPLVTPSMSPRSLTVISVVRVDQEG